MTETTTIHSATETVTCTAHHCRYCRAAADYLGLPQGHPRACRAAKQADQMGEMAAFAYLRSLKKEGVNSHE